MIKKIIPKFIKDYYHFFVSFLGAFLNGFPSKKIKVIGITGTNGKSTTVSIVVKILEEAGYKVAASTSIFFKIGEKVEENKLKMTMPGRFILQSFLRKAVKEKCDYAIIEVTSEGIKQHRHRFIDFKTALITNLNPEHIEAHKGFENYKKAKGELFKIVKDTHIINIDDDHKDYFLSFKAKKVITYSIENKKADIRAEEVNATYEGTKFKVKGVDFESKLLFDFNVYNILAGITVGLSEGLSLEKCSLGVKKVEQVPGRMEEVVSFPFKVFVDYAFTPNALEKVYKFLKPKSGKLICVLGACGGGRDKWKRPVLGNIAEKYGDVVIVTNEDPYDENPEEIINQVLKGSSKAIKIIDRREAIRKAISFAEKGDVVIITGKGCEPWICVDNGKRIPWDDRKIVREEMSC
ncbi:MAG TPA: UDP-N-acetylmuramoyl-L-alanyl-D-glutamate--2,6-diaminopimelate ligase [Candidatus Pacearchaeota archaeon]|nr:UDP-N-acetylmuramoyl-L-alanyl-D-glutamate--2,6-diaminopimelate ligase [Candidatus Pacearchaeota archaeon]HQM24536.1 UDP-N-acetylmuramoyl-L-alanyl-D-glutamate--2,6-diaminopimelate ligase [Candidatus Pacearchaeota archaeon]